MDIAHCTVFRNTCTSCSANRNRLAVRLGQCKFSAVSNTLAEPDHCCNETQLGVSYRAIYNQSRLDAKGAF